MSPEFNDHVPVLLYLLCYDNHYHFIKTYRNWDSFVKEVPFLKVHYHSFNSFSQILHIYCKL